MAKNRICNICEKDIVGNHHTGLSIKHDFGYFSEFDGDKLKVNLCDECLDIVTRQLINMCKINPIIENPVMESNFYSVIESDC